MRFSFVMLSAIFRRRAVSAGSFPSCAFLTVSVSISMVSPFSISASMAFCCFLAFLLIAFTDETFAESSTIRRACAAPFAGARKAATKIMRMYCDSVFVIVVGVTKGLTSHLVEHSDDFLQFFFVAEVDSDFAFALL